MPYFLAILSVSAIAAASLVIETAGLGSSSGGARRAAPELLTVPNRVLKGGPVTLGTFGARGLNVRQNDHYSYPTHAGRGRPRGIGSAR